MRCAVVSLARKKSGKWYARKAIPADVRETYGKREEKQSWPATLTEGQAKAELAAWLAPIEDRIAALRAHLTFTTVTLTRRQSLKLAGEWYRAKVEAEESRFTEAPGVWDWDADVIAILPEDDPEGVTEGQPLRPLPFIVEERDRLVVALGLRLDARSAEQLLQDMLRLYLDFLQLMQRRVAGDFGPDPVLAVLPTYDAPPPQAKRAVAVSITKLFDDYAATGALQAHTVRKWRSAVQSFVEHLGHDDAQAVTRADVSAWLQSLVSKGLSVKTVRGTYRAAVARVFSSAVGFGRLKVDPAARAMVIGPKAKQVHRRSISDEEARTILKAAVGPHRENLSERHALARRWVPWICAYTGARVGEITQLRAGDILQEDGVWVFRITPEAGSVKTGQARYVPIHSHLIEQGVLRLAQPGSTDPLFYDPKAARQDGAAQPQPKQLASKLAKWVRDLGVRDVPQPNHGWRHRFKTTARLSGLDRAAADMMQGHAPRTEGDKYGEWPPRVLLPEVEKLPRFIVT